MQWVQDFVVNLNLCPFAESVMKNETHRVVIRDDVSSFIEANTVLRDEIKLLLETPPEQVTTTLIVLPNYRKDNFISFHYDCGMFDDMVEDSEEFNDSVMMAYFHPCHQWADAKDPKDAINFDKRSPFPILNILRTVQVDEYIEQGRTQDILPRNQRTLCQLGDDEVNKRFDALHCIH